MMLIGFLIRRERERHSGELCKLLGNASRGGYTMLESHSQWQNYLRPDAWKQIIIIKKKRNSHHRWIEESETLLTSCTCTFLYNKEQQQFLFTFQPFALCVPTAAVVEARSKQVLPEGRQKVFDQRRCKRQTSFDYALKRLTCERTEHDGNHTRV